MFLVSSKKNWWSDTTDEILNTTDEVERISKTHFKKEVTEVVLGLQNCSVAFMDAKNGFLTKFHIEMVIQKKSSSINLSGKTNRD